MIKANIINKVFFKKSICYSIDNTIENLEVEYLKTLLYNGKIYLEREKFDEAILIEDGIILKTGKNEELLKEIDDNCKKIDCKGKTVVPGFNDSHMHLLWFGQGLSNVNINNCKSIEELIERCKNFITQYPERTKYVLHSSGWNQDLFEKEKRILTRHDLDKISTEIPIILERVCGHILATNTKAIEMLGLNENSPQYPGGTFEKESNGYPNGVFTENACHFVKKLIPKISIKEYENMFMEAMRYAVAHGVTSVHSNDIGVVPEDKDILFNMFHRIFKEGKSLLRYHHQVCFNELDKFKEYIENGEFVKGDYPEDSWLTLGPLKLFKDGSLGARTALMSSDYKDAPGVRGEVWMSEETMLEYCKLADKAGMQVVTHVIGDQAVKDTIKCYEAVFRDGKNPLRHELIHCQITDSKTLQEIVQKDILVSYQPIFLDYDMHVVEARCGKELASTSYAFNTLEKLGAHISYGSDCPVESCNPFPNIYSAVTRKDSKGWPENGFYPNECVDVYTAVDAYTLGSAYAQFMENKKGRIKAGYYADLVVLDRDIFTIDPMEIRDIQVELTMVGGKVVYQK